MHIAVLTTAHPTDDVRVKSKIVDSFLAADNSVSWVGPEKSFFTADRDPRVRWHLTPHGLGRARRLVAAPQTLASAWQLSPELRDVDWIYTPDPDAALLALPIARRWGAHTLFDIHEEFHKGLLERWVGARAGVATAGLVRAGIARVCRHTDLVIGVNESVLEPYVDAARTLVVRNAAPAWFADGVPTRSGEGPLMVAHGKALPGNGTPVVLKALARLATHPLVPGDPGVRVLMFPGNGPVDGATYIPDFADVVARSGVAESLWLSGAVTHDQMPGLLDRCEVGMIAYGRTLGVGSLPNRLFEYMARGLAILAPSYSREIREIVEAEGIGRTVDFEDPAAVSGELAWFAAHRDDTREMGERARGAFVERFSWEAEFERLIDAMRARDAA